MLDTCPAEGRLLLCLKLTLLGASGLLRAPGKVLALEGTEETTAGLLKWGEGEEGQLQRRYHTLGFSVMSQAKDPPAVAFPFVVLGSVGQGKGQAVCPMAAQILCPPPSWL